MAAREDPNYPRYLGDTAADNRQNYLSQLGGKRAFSGWFDKGFFVFAGLASLWLAVVAIISVLGSSWWALPLVILVWCFAAYMTLPRFHHIMTTLYVPSYFIGRTQTGDGLLGDPVNLGLRGESVDIHTAMRAAGWHEAEPVTLASSWRIIVNTILKRPYPTAPVSPLYLFNRKEDFAYQQEVDGSPEKRHHVRFWKTPHGWKLPGGEEVDWLGAATFDRAVGLSLFTFQITHKIDADTDKERDYVVDTVRYCNPQADLSVIEDFSTGYHSRNGGGDAIITDGNLPILELDHVVTQTLEIPDHAPESKYSHHRSPWELVESLPLSLALASGFVGLVALLQLAQGLTHLVTSPLVYDLLHAMPLLTAFEKHTESGVLVDSTVMLALVATALVQCGLAVSVVHGRQRSRKIQLVLLAASFVVIALRMLGEHTASDELYSVFVLMASYVFAMLEYTSDAAVNYTYNSTHSRKTRKRQQKKTQAT